MAANSHLSLVELAPPSELSHHAQRLIERGMMRRTKSVSQAEIVSHFNNVFSMIGGVPRLALWADEHPSEFFAMYSKLLPSAAKLEVSHVDASNLKTVTTEQLKFLLMAHIENVSIDAEGSNPEATAEVEPELIPENNADQPDPDTAD